jgi:hypothetical protein
VYGRGASARDRFLYPETEKFSRFEEEEEEGEEDSCD